MKAQRIGHPQTDNLAWRALPLFNLPYHRLFNPGQRAKLLQGKTLTDSLLFQPVHNIGQYPRCVPVVHQEQNGAGPLYSVIIPL